VLNDHAILARVLAAAGSCAGMSTIRAGRMVGGLVPLACAVADHPDFDRGAPEP